MLFLYQKLWGWPSLARRWIANPLVLRPREFESPSSRKFTFFFKKPVRIIYKGNNSFFIFQHQIGTKGVLSFNRIITVFPTPSFVNISDDWGKISDFSRLLQRKYKQS